MAGGTRIPFDNKIVEWVDSRLPVFTLMQREYGVFPTPKNFNYFWNFGAIATVMLVVMIATGVVLAMHYTPNANLAFASVERIMRDVNWGWMIRYLHANGASFFFIAVYVHIFRGLYYGSYKKPRELLWIFGVVIFLLMMATAFMGYTLPWSQMGGWGATVITSLFSAIPFVGDKLTTLLWGGFSVDNPTLNRFFALHYLLPFVICAVVGLHVWALHVTGSNNPLGIEVKGPQDTLPFHPYFTAKDTFGISLFLIAYVVISFWLPNLFGHPDAYTEFDPLKTPPHIVPEWYFLPFYAILRSLNFGVNPYVVLSLLLGAGAWWFAFRGPVIPKEKSGLILALAGGAGLFFAIGYLSQYEGAHGKMMSAPMADKIFVDAKLAGVLAMFGAVAVLGLLPWLDTHPVRSSRFRPLFRLVLLVMVADVFALGYIGSQPADAQLFGLPMIWFGQLGTGYYLMFFLVICPFLSRTEKALPLPESINEAILKGQETVGSA